MVPMHDSNAKNNVEQVKRGMSNFLNSNVQRAELMRHPAPDHCSPLFRKEK